MALIMVVLFFLALSLPIPGQEAVSRTGSWIAGLTGYTVSEGIVPGGSLDMSKSRVNSYATYGRGELNSGLVVIKVGYSKAF